MNITPTVNGQTREQWIADRRDPEAVAAHAAEIIADAQDTKTYTDPHPGKKGTDRIVYVCDKCGGSGQYFQPSSMGDMCFRCNGTGETSRLVSTERGYARQDVNEYNAMQQDRRDNAHQYAADYAEQRLAEQWNEALDDEEAKAATAAAERAAETYPEGEKFDNIRATVSRQMFIDNNYGGTLLTAFTLDGDDTTEMVWFSNSQAAYRLEPGDRLTLSGTTKDTGTYRGRASVKVARCKVADHQPAHDDVDTEHVA